MIKHIILGGVIAFTLVSCSKNNFSISGEIKDAGKQKAYLELLNIDNNVVVDSASIGSNGKFSFKTNITLPTFYNLRTTNGEVITVLAEPGKDIRISGTAGQFANNYTVDGSEASSLIKELNTRLNTTKNILDSLQKVYNNLPQGETSASQRQALETQWDSTVTGQIKYSRDFVLENAVSPVSYYALYQKLDNNNFVLDPLAESQSYRIVASSMQAMYPESQYAKAIYAHYNQITKDLKTQKIRELIQNADKNLPLIALPNIHGDTISLHSLRGKYIILDFTVLSEPELKGYIETLKKVYNKYHSKGVEIYQVCLDPNKLAWEEAVRRYDIKWICVRDAQGLKSIIAQNWNVQNIPANYIIGKQYDIVGKNLEGKSLEDRLNDIIK